MFFKDEKGTNVVQFGKGDINVSPALLDIPDETVGALTFEEREPSPIGTPGTERTCDNCMVGDDHTRLVFTNIESLDAVMGHMQHLREIMTKDSTT